MHSQPRQNRINKLSFFCQVKWHFFFLFLTVMKKHDSGDRQSAAIALICAERLGFHHDIAASIHAAEKAKCFLGRLMKTAWILWIPWKVSRAPEGLWATV